MTRTVAGSQGGRIVLVMHSHIMGGIERHVVTLADRLAEVGYHVTYAGPLDGWLGERMRSAGFECVHLPMRGMYDILSLRRLLRFCRDRRVDLVHGHAQRGARYAGWAGRRLGLPVVATAHSTHAWKWFDQSMTVIAVSGAVRDALITAGMRDDRVHVVHSGVEDIGSSVLSAISVPEGNDGADSADTLRRPLVLGMLSRLERVKGHDIALQALALVRSRLAVRLVIVGPDDTGWARFLRARVAGMALEDAVEFQGARHDLRAAFEQFDIVLSPSRREALPLTLIEAASAARPVIAADIGGIPEIVLHDETGLLVPPEDPEALARAILRLGGDIELRMRLARGARARFEQHFTPESMLKRTLRVYAHAQGTQRGETR